MLGDAWFVQEGIFDRLVDTCPDATFVNMGNGGDSAANLSARFQADVAPEKPDTVVVLVGTNDYVLNTDPDSFNWYINQIKVQCYEIGAHPIFITTSAGNSDLSGTQFNFSRIYANKTNYYDEDKNAINQGRKEQIISIGPTIVPNGTSRISVNIGTQGGESTLTEYYLTGDTFSLEARTDMGGALSTSVVLTPNALVTTDLTLSFTGDKFIDVLAANVTGAEITIFGYIKILVD